MQPTDRSWRGGFWSLIVTQFQGAFSDNVLKNLVVFMLIGMDVSLAEKHRIGEMVGALFSLPFILFSMTGGFLADRFSKRTVSVGVKIFEICTMIFVLIGFSLNKLPLLLAAVFLMGVHSAIFGPSKYGLLPELLPEKKLSWGNGVLELGTFVAIIAGTVMAAFLSQKFYGRQIWSGAVLIALAAFGFVTCLGITKVPAADPKKRYRLNFLKQAVDEFRLMRGDRPLLLALLGNVYFSFLGALLLLNLFFYGSNVLHVDELGIGKLNVALAMGIGLGSVAAGYLSGGKIEYGLVPMGAVGLSVTCAALGIPHMSVTGALTCLALLGFAGGFFIVPISALLQHRPNKERKGEVLAFANWSSFIGVFLASGAHHLLAETLKITPNQIFLIGGVMTLAGAAYTVVLLPDQLLRFVLWSLTHTLYRVRVNGRDNIPEKGGALFVCNHLSMADAMFLIASTDRFIRFMMFKDNYEKPFIKPLAKMLGIIPISSTQGPREMIKSLKDATDAIKRGEVVCIFPEGEVTRIGQMLPFQRGFERIMKDVDAPIIPVALDGVWGSIFSFADGKFYWKLPRRIPYPITVQIGEPMPAHSTPVEVRQMVQDLHCEAWAARRETMLPLHRAFIQNARRNPFRFAMAESSGQEIKCHDALTRCIFLARRLKPKWAGQEMVGILLPPSIGGALVNMAALLAGKVPVNLNYTLSESSLEACIKQANIRTVITSKAFSEKVKLKVSCELLMLEELAENPGALEKFSAALMAWCVPTGLLERSLAGKSARMDDLATVIFSSGSTGEPKGVMLTHYNIGSNIQQLGQVFGLTEDDRVLGILPFFHSFGFTATLMLPLILGVGVVYHVSPLDSKVIGPLVRERKVTFLLGTPTFLQFYLRACTPEDFGGLRLVMAAAEKLPERVATAFEDKFGIRPLEGYGCTECSPAVSVNTHDFRAAGYRQVGAKRGKIGHPLPGMTVRIVDPETRAPLPIGDAGLLLVRGANVMKGYLGKPEKTAEVLRDGWYCTGDIAAVDEDGFIEIRDRLSRFSKIGGEMVPHIKVEETLHETICVTDQTFVVTGVPDESKGERLVVLHTASDVKLAECLQKLPGAGLPNLWVPRSNQFFKVEKIPILGTGKVDLRKVREEAIRLSTTT